MHADSPGNGFGAIPNSATFGARRRRRHDVSAQPAKRSHGDPPERSSRSRSTRWQGGGPNGGSPFAPDPNTGAVEAPAVAWNPELDTSVLTIVRPVPWARPIGDLRFLFERWGERVFRIGSPGGTHLLIRRRGAPELSLWLPSGLAPARGGGFGIYLHPDNGHTARVQAATTFRRAIGHGTPLRHVPFAHARRHAAMLCVHDLSRQGASLRDIAELLLDPMPPDWRTSSERSDLRRLLDVGEDMIGQGYRRLLGPRPPS